MPNNKGEYPLGQHSIYINIYTVLSNKENRLNYDSG